MRTEHRGPSEGRGTTDDNGDPAAIRLRTVEILDGAGAPLSMTDLALELLGADGADDVDQGRVRRLKIGLYHRHLPKLDRAGVVEFDHERRSVALVQNVTGEEGPVVPAP